MKRTVPQWDLLDAMARDLAGVLADGTLMPSAQPEAQLLLARARLALDGPRRDSPVGLRGLTEGIDRLLVLACPRLPGSGDQPAHPDRLKIADRLLTFCSVPLMNRMSKLEDSVDALAHRTRRMVEHAQPTVAKATRRFVAPSETRAPEGRAAMELVWGDDET